MRYSVEGFVDVYDKARCGASEVGLLVRLQEVVCCPSRQLHLFATFVTRG